MMLPVLGPEETEEDRRNLKLTSGHGSVNADITLVGGQEDVPLENSKSKKRVFLDVYSQYNTVNIKLVKPFYCYHTRS